MSLVHGVVSNLDLVPLLLDASGRVILAAGANEIGSVQARSYGWIGAAWQKDPLRIGYSNRLLARQDRMDAGGDGTLTANATTVLWTVPAGESWIVTVAKINIITLSTITGVSFFADPGSGTVSLELTNTLTAAGLTVNWNLWFHLAPGDRLATSVGSSASPITAPYRVMFEVNALIFDLDQ